jgi:uncharacterized protein (DUF1800 family)
MKFKDKMKKEKMLAKFEESSKALECCLKSQKSFRDRTGLGFNSNEPSTSKTKQVTDCLCTFKYLGMIQPFGPSSFLFISLA